VRSREEVTSVIEFVRAGWNDCEIARETGIPRGTIKGWRIGANSESS
jgi:DNA-binding NarL/FixJ family response regulator